VLVMGATGTGKELVARALHEASQRQGDLVPVNMSRLDTAMANSELFGHERGAFTGANARREGAFSQAQDGTLFLDEIGDMPLDVQRKLLRTLEAHTFKPLGAQRDRETNARIVAATNRSLTEAIETQEFRADLLERLRALPITVPSLVQRRWDIPLLFVHFLHLQTQQYPQLEWMWPRALHNDAPPVPLRFILRLLSHSWGGNVRQLRNRVTELTAANIGGAPFTDPPNFDDSFLQHSGPQAAAQGPPHQGPAAALGVVPAAQPGSARGAAGDAQLQPEPRRRGRPGRAPDPDPVDAPRQDAARRGHRRRPPPTDAGQTRRRHQRHRP
jgi:DNA-binding NtrC family response regulator